MSSLKAYLSLALLMLIGTFACQDEPGRTPADSNETVLTPGSALLPVPDLARIDLAAELEEQLESHLDELIFLAAWERALRHELSESTVNFLRDYRKRMLLPLYEEVGFRPVFAELMGPINERAYPLIAELNAVYQHALDPTPYVLDEIAEAQQAVETLHLAGPIWPISEDVFETLVELAVERDWLQSDDRMERLARAAVGLDGSSPTPYLAVAYEELRPELDEVLPPLVTFELRLVNSFLSYAFDLADFNVNQLTYAELQELGGALELQRERLRDRFRDAAGSTPGSFARQLDDLVPEHPQYALLMQSLAQYRAIVDAGGWQHVNPRTLHEGNVSSRVRELKERLQIEGYYDGPIDNVYDEALTQAVASYQEAHQMDVTGEPHNMFWSSLNVPAERRLAHIELTLQRWRESRFDWEGYYVYVNVPDFHAEVWRDGERLARFRVVVGNNTRECNPETGFMELANATPLIRADIEYLVFNPYWNVPPRIRQDELDLELMENPLWLQENGFEVIVTETGPRIRQLPGEGNALGQVKFIFPNLYNIYMHDTPLRRYFRLPIRAYSHGCVRVHEPLEFAELLLTQDGNWDAQEVQAILDSRVETTRHLDTHVPIVIEYYVVRVDDEGRTNFLSDVYRYDRERLGEYEPEPCVVEETLEEELVIWNEDGSAVIPDGTIIHADGNVEWSEERLAEYEGIPPTLETEEEQGEEDRDLGP